MKFILGFLAAVLCFLAQTAFAETVQSEAVKAGLRVTPIDAGQVVCRTGKWTSATDTVTGNATEHAVAEMVPVPAGAMITYIDGLITDLGAATKTVDIGDGAVNTRFFSALDGHTADVILRASTFQKTGVGYVYTANDTVDILVRNASIAVDTPLVLNVCYKMADRITDEKAVFNP